MKQNLDRTDLRILALLQDDARMTVAEISSRVHLSRTPCWRRIQQMEESGVIERRVALIDPAKVGLPLSVFVEIEAADRSRKWLDRFAEAITEMPEIMEVYRMAGEADYLLRVSVSDAGQYDAFYQRLIERVPVKNVTSRLAIDRLKRTTAYPIQHEYPPPPRSE